MQKKLIKCSICGSREILIYKKYLKFSYYLCKTCQSLILHPTPNTRDLQNFYKNKFDYSNGEKEEEIIRKRSHSIFKKLKSLNPKGIELLDIGSGLGYFLDEANKKGYKTTGIEPSQKLFRYSTNNLKLTIQNMTFESYLQKNKKKYDFISLIHVIEHIKNPTASINLIFKHLRKGGILLIESPNLDSHLFSYEREQYSYMSIPEHLWVFSKKSLTKFILKRISS